MAVIYKEMEEGNADDELIILITELATKMMQCDYNIPNLYACQRVEDRHDATPYPSSSMLASRCSPAPFHCYHRRLHCRPDCHLSHSLSLSLPRFPLLLFRFFPHHPDHRNHGCSFCQRRAIHSSTGAAPESGSVPSSLKLCPHRSFPSSRRSAELFGLRAFLGHANNGLRAPQIRHPVCVGSARSRRGY